MLDLVTVNTTGKTWLRSIYLEVYYDVFQMGTFDTTLVVMALAATHNLPRLTMSAECTDNAVTTMNLTTEYATNHDGEVLTVACAADYFMTDATDGSDFNGGGAGANYTMRCNNERKEGTKAVRGSDARILLEEALRRDGSVREQQQQ